MTDPSPQEGPPEGAQVDPQVDPQEGRLPTQEEMAAALVYRLGRIPVRDVLLQTMATLADMAGIRMGLGPEEDAVRDLTQSRHAIEALRALLGVAETELGAAQARPFKEPLAQLQLMYARMAEDEAGGAAEGEGPAPSEPPPEPAGPDPASRLWVPPHHR